MSRRARYSVVGKLALLVCMAVVAIAQVDVRTMFAQFDKDLLLSALVVQPILIASIGFQAARHAILVRTPPAPYGQTLKAVLLSVGLNAVLPGRLAELLKAIYLRDHAAIPLSAGLAAVVLERAVDLIIVGALAVVSILFLLGGASTYSVAALTLVVGGLLAVLPWAEKHLIPWVRRVRWRRGSSFLERFIGHLASRLRSTVFFYALGLGLLAWAASYAGVALFLREAGTLELSHTAALMVFVATTLGGAVPALPGGFGTYEAAAVFALVQLGYPFEKALALAIGLHVANLVVPLGSAGAIMLLERTGLSSIVKQLRSGKDGAG